MGHSQGIVPDSKQPSVLYFCNQGTARTAVFVAGNRQVERISHDAVPLENDIQGHEQPHVITIIAMGMNDSISYFEDQALNAQIRGMNSSLWSTAGKEYVYFIILSIIF